MLGRLEVSMVFLHMIDCRSGSRSLSKGRSFAPVARTGLIRKSRNARWAVQLGFAAASLFGLILVKNFHLLETDQEALDAVCKTPQQAEIALNFYEKTLNRNKVLREILGADSDGGFCFTPEGEYQPFLYEIPQLTSLRVRRDYCRDLRNYLDWTGTYWIFSFHSPKYGGQTTFVRNSEFGGGWIMQFQILSILPTQEYLLQKRGFSEFSSNHAPVPSWGTCFSIRGKIVGRKADDEVD